jgi:hypothetical protein
MLSGRSTPDARERIPTVATRAATPKATWLPATGYWLLATWLVGYLATWLLGYWLEE